MPVEDANLLRSFGVSLPIEVRNNYSHVPNPDRGLGSLKCDRCGLQFLEPIGKFASSQVALMVKHIHAPIHTYTASELISQLQKLPADAKIEMSVASRLDGSRPKKEPITQTSSVESHGSIYFRTENQVVCLRVIR